MAQLSKFLRSIGGGGLAYWCQGCKEAHVVWVEHNPEYPNRPVWSWNGDVEEPVFGPSVLVTSGHYMANHKEGDPCWCTYNKEKREKGEPEAPCSCNRCHTFIGCNGAAPGQVIFLGDSTHKFAGQVLPLPELPGSQEP